ncbi:MAG: hypothetical protein HFF06_09095 [Oscillospiraceae bacterium]|nr:hypothetical protein [Oscillospiraceae bacterium]
MRRNHSEDLQHQAEHSRTRRPPVLSYLVILFAVAFLLLLLAYFQQQRVSDQTTDALKQSVSAVGAIENMMGENEDLRQEVSSLKEEYQKLEDLYQTESQARGELEGQAVALDYLWRIQRFWDRGNRTEALALVKALEESGFASSLPRTSPSGAEGSSPLDQYNALLDALDYRSEP